jgi:glycine cleavage system H lipoate-binding protein
MESFRYVDIFATKGIEYIIVIAFLTGFVFFSRYLSHRTPAPAAAEGMLKRFVDYFRVPDEHHFHQGHSWLRKDARETVTVGMDDFAQRFLGKVDAMELPRVGATLRQGEKGWSLTAESRIIPMLSPVDGEVIAVNPAALRTPTVVNEDPYGNGWLLKVKPARLAANTRNLLSGNVARTWVEESLNGIRLQSGESLGLVYQDGGAPVSGMAKALYGEEWEKEVRRLLLTEGE